MVLIVNLCLQYVDAITTKPQSQFTWVMNKIYNTDHKYQWGLQYVGAFHHYYKTMRYNVRFLLFFMCDICLFFQLCQVYKCELIFVLFVCVLAIESAIMYMILGVCELVKLQILTCDLGFFFLKKGQGYQEIPCEEHC